MAVQAGAVELGDDEDAVDAGIQAVADGDVDEAELAAHRYGRLGSVPRQGPQTASLSAAQDRCHDFLHGHLPSLAVRSYSSGWDLRVRRLSQQIDRPPRPSSPRPSSPSLPPRARERGGERNY